MALSVRTGKKGGGSKSQPEPGTYVARLVGITDLGHQPGFEYRGQEVESQWKIEFTYELVDSLMEDGRPHWVSEDVNNNDFEGDSITSTMMARVRSIDKTNETENGKDLTKMIGKPCMVTITHDDKGYAKIKGQAAISGVPSSMEVKELSNPSFVFEMDNPDMNLWDKFPEFKQMKIRAALNFDQTELAKNLAEDGDY